MNPDATLYDALVEAGCRIDNHESDFYVLATGKALAIVAQFVDKPLYFRGTDGLPWVEVPFAYQPYWRAKQRAAA
jgi:hypothetical protein